MGAASHVGAEPLLCIFLLSLMAWLTMAHPLSQP